MRRTADELASEGQKGVNPEYKRVFYAQAGAFYFALNMDAGARTREDFENFLMREVLWTPASAVASADEVERVDAANKVPYPKG
jgi:hypothetical protein